MASKKTRNRLPSDELKRRVKDPSSEFAHKTHVGKRGYRRVQANKRAWDSEIEEYLDGYYMEL